MLLLLFNQPTQQTSITTATGGTDDISNRIRSTLPPWFPDAADSPILTSVITGIADAFSFIYDYLGFAALQTRISTASGGWLDMIGWDFFGARFTRRQGESDASWQPRVQQEILRPRQTRAAISQLLSDLTGRAPRIVELWNAQDCGGYGVAQMGGYGSGPGCYGSLSFNDQVLVTAFHAPTEGIPNADGYGEYNGGYGVGIIEYGSLSFVTGPITDAEIYARVQQTIAAGTTAWVTIQNPPPILTTESGLILTTESGNQLVIG
jgi:hypothetical protein